MTAMQRDVPTGAVAGTFDDRFAGVVDEFVRNFADRREVGASLCITHDGRTVVDHEQLMAVLERDPPGPSASAARCPGGPSR